MHRTLWTVVVLAGTLASPLTAQDARFNAEEEAAANAIVGWFADHLSDDTPQPTLVLATKTNGAAVAPSARGFGVVPSAKRSVQLASNSIEAIESRTSVAIHYCDELREGSLCGIAHPWVWVLLSSPARDGDRWLFEVEERAIAGPPPGVSDTGRMETSSYLVEARLDDGQWRVRIVE